MFNTENSARRIVQKSPSWKSRSLNLGNRHRTTLNFGDLVPAFWQFAQPGDKWRMDASILAKFMPLIAPAFSRMRIKTEWFYVPLRQISPSSLRALQDFKPEPQNVASYFTQLMHGFSRTESKVSENQQFTEMSGFPSIPTFVLSEWLCGETATRICDNTSSSSGVVLGSGYSVSKWRGGAVSFSDYSQLGLENLTTYSTKRRASRLMSYMGLPSRVTQMQYVTDVVRYEGEPFLASYGYDDDLHQWVISDQSGLQANIYIDRQSGSSSMPQLDGFISRRYLALSFSEDAFSVGSDNIVYTPNYGRSFTFSTAGTSNYFIVQSWDLNGYGYGETHPWFLGSYTQSSFEVSDAIAAESEWSSSHALPALCTYSKSLVSLLPFSAYQKIFNDFYRDEKLQSDEIRYYPTAVLNADATGLQDSHDPNLLIASWKNPYTVITNNQSSNNAGGWSRSNNILLNNLFGLRRRNRSKDVISSCVTSQVVTGQLQNGEDETVYNANLYSKLAKYFMKKEFTGSTWAEWLNNFFGVNSNDLLNNNVIFLGGRESVVSISENIQNSESTDTSAQGNRAGLANDFHNGNEIYFRVPDFGVIMCIVSVIPDDLDNFNGLQERFKKDSVFDWNLPDLQNIGFAPVLNQRVNVGFFAGDTTLPFFDHFPDNKSRSTAVFGYQPFGYEHTYTPNIISGDLQSSLRYWHQSPDLDFDFTRTRRITDNLNVLQYRSWADNQLALNANLPSIGLRFQPLGSDLAAQYYNNVFAVTNDESGDHIVADMRFAVTVHRNTAFFTDAIDNTES